jgi:hypothetical protein
MKKNETLVNEEKTTGIATILGGLLIALSVVDFALSFAGINLTSFLGPISRFTPIATGLLGGFLINSDKN